MNYQINHGRAIIRDYHRKQFYSKVKALVTKVLEKVGLYTSVSVFLLAGFLSASVITGIVK